MQLLDILPQVRIIKYKGSYFESNGNPKASKKPLGSRNTEGLPVAMGSVLAVHKELFVKPLANIVSGYACCDGQ